MGLLTTEPSDDELYAFVEAMLSNLDRRLREPEVIEEAVGGYRDTWLLLYRASVGFASPT